MGKITVSGMEAQVKAGVEIVNGILAQAPDKGGGKGKAMGNPYADQMDQDPNPTGAKENVRYVQVPEQHVGLVVGKQWNTLRGFRDEARAMDPTNPLCVQCYIDQKTMGPGEPKQFVVWGPCLPAVLQMEAKVSELVQFAMRPKGAPKGGEMYGYDQGKGFGKGDPFGKGKGKGAPAAPEDEVYADIPTGALDALAPEAGMIQAQSGAKLMVPGGADPVKRVRIIGPPSSIHALLGLLTPRIPEIFVVGSDPKGAGPALGKGAPPGVDGKGKGFGKAPPPAQDYVPDFAAPQPAAQWPPQPAAQAPAPAPAPAAAAPAAGQPSSEEIAKMW